MAQNLPNISQSPFRDHRIASNTNEDDDSEACGLSLKKEFTILNWTSKRVNAVTPPLLHRGTSCDLHGKFLHACWKRMPRCHIFLSDVHFSKFAGNILTAIFSVAASKRGIKTDGVSKWHVFLSFEIWRFGARLFWYPFGCLQIHWWVICCRVFSQTLRFSQNTQWEQHSHVPIWPANLTSTSPNLRRLTYLGTLRQWIQKKAFKECSENPSLPRISGMQPNAIHCNEHLRWHCCRTKLLVLSSKIQTGKHGSKNVRKRPLNYLNLCRPPKTFLTGAFWNFFHWEFKPKLKPLFHSGVFIRSWCWDPNLGDRRRGKNLEKFVPRRKNPKTAVYAQKIKKSRGLGIRSGDPNLSGRYQICGLGIHRWENFQNRSGRNLEIFLENLGGSQRQLCIRTRPLLVHYVNLQACPRKIKCLEMFWGEYHSTENHYITSRYFPELIMSDVM